MTCGLWLARRRLVAALVSDGGTPVRTLRAALTDDARYGLLEYLVATGCEVVATDATARTDLLLSQAARRGLVVWTVEDVFAGALIRAAALREPTRAAALLARLPLIAALRPCLRRLAPPPGTAQLPLL